MRMLLLLLIAALLAGRAVSADQPVSVTLDPSVRHQTILGWGKTMPLGPAADLLRDRASSGGQRPRPQPPALRGPLRQHAQPAKLGVAQRQRRPARRSTGARSTRQLLDQRARDWIVPWKQAVEARGEPFNLYVSPSFFHGGSTGDVPPWMLGRPAGVRRVGRGAAAAPARRARRRRPTSTASATRRATTTPSPRRWSRRMMRRLVPRLRAAGLPDDDPVPRVRQRARGPALHGRRCGTDPDLWQWIGLISYHWYGGDNQSAMAELRDFAASARPAHRPDRVHEPDHRPPVRRPDHRRRVVLGDLRAGRAGLPGAR